MSISVIMTLFLTIESNSRLLPEVNLRHLNQNFCSESAICYPALSLLPISPFLYAINANPKFTGKCCLKLY